MLADSRAMRSSSNSLFAISDYDGAMAGYERALAALPAYLEYETAVLRANMAACFVKMKEWKRVVEEADRGLDSLGDWERENERPLVEDEDAAEPRDGTASDGGPGQTEAQGTKNSDDAEPSHEDVCRIRSKLLLRRAKAGVEMGGWAALQRSLEDYSKLSKLDDLSSLDRKTVRDALGTLPHRVEEAQQNEMGEMMGKLKELGNGILKPFGLSTENFSMVKDQGTGGYNMSFQQGSR